MEEISFEEPPEPVVNNVTSGRGGRNSGPGRKPVAATAPTPSLPKRPNYEDSPTPTMSQLKAQMAAAAVATTTPEKNSTTHAPHMFGNALNPTSSMAQRLVDNLSQEIEMAASGAGPTDPNSPVTTVVGIGFPGKSSSSSAVTVPKPSTSTNSNSSSIPITNGGLPPNSTSNSKPSQPQTLEELLERQWEQGSQFLMEQAQHLDIAQLLSCLNQLKQDNKALEDHVASLCQRKEQLTAINARLSIPLGSSASMVGPGFSNAGGQGTPPLAIHQGAKNPPPAPHQQLQQQIQQEAIIQQGRAITHSFPGTEVQGRCTISKSIENGSRIYILYICTYMLRLACMCRTHRSYVYRFACGIPTSFTTRCRM